MRRTASRTPLSSSRASTSAAEVTIETLAPGGDGVAHVEIARERRAVFVRGTVPGDRARVAIDASSRPARGELLELLARGATRAEPPCAYTTTCGGCDWMHVTPDGQQHAHEAHVRGVLPAPWRGIAATYHPAPEGLGARSRARFHARASGGRAIVGMNETRTNDPVEVDRCVIMHPVLERARAGLAALLDGAHGRGEAHVALGPLGHPRLPVLDLRWSGPLAAACFGRFERAVAEGAWAGVRVVYGETTRPAIIGDPTPWMLGADGAPLRLATGGFGQSSEAGNALLAGRVAALATSCAAERITELYAGAGNFTVLLAREGAARDVVAIEASAAACAAARENLTARGLSPRARIVEADAAEYAWSPATSLVVLDPPRTGARAVALRLVERPVKHVLYVSCDAATLGRDLALLEPAYTLAALEIVEMFPFTSHVEVVALLTRARGSGNKRASA